MGENGMKKRNNLTKKNGFTLTELMAVTIILGILAAIAIGSFRQSVERAKFSEGLRAAQEVAGSLDRYYYDHPGTYGSAIDFNKLDVSLTNSGDCNASSTLCTKVKNFEISIHQDNKIPYVVAYRDKVGSANYQIWATPDLNRRQTGTGMSNKVKVLIKYSDLCYSNSGNKKDICNVMGYTQECDNAPSEGVYWCK